MGCIQRIHAVTLVQYIRNIAEEIKGRLQYGYNIIVGRKVLEKFDHYKHKR